MKRLILTISIAACSGGQRERVEPAPVVAAEAAPARANVVLITDEPSLYDLDVSLTSADGESIATNVGRGRPMLISMFYASCSAACPALIGALKQAVENAPPETEVLLVSFDPERDTPATLRELAATHKLDARWKLAVADDSNARTLAALLGIKYRRVPSGEFFHNAVIVAVDAEGVPIARMTGLGDATALTAALR